MINLSLRTKLITLVTLILLAGFAATNILNFEVSKGVLRTTILENELPLSSNNIYSAIQADLLRPIFISSMMAHDTFVQDWVLEDEMNADRMVRYLAQIRNQYQTFTSYFISAKTLRYYHYKGVSRTLSETNPEDRWFFAARDMHDPYVVNVDFNYQQSHNITIFINYRVVDGEGNFLGVTGVGLGLSSVSDLVKTYQEKFRRHVYFVDEAGLIRVHAEPDVAGKTTIFDIDGLKDIAKQVLAKDHGSYTYETQEGKILLTTRYIPELKWHLFIELPESEALKNMRAGFFRNLLIAPAVILITIFLIGYSINIFQRRLEELAITDKLTGLNNRQHFDSTLSQAVKRFGRDGRAFSLLMMDIDHFKSINDEMGHLAGDNAIRMAAKIIGENARESDLTCRWGGEEFVILAPECSAQDAHRLSDAIRDAIRDAALFPEHPERTVTMSIGIAEIRAGDTEVSLIGRADRAMYMAKSNGRDRTEFA